MMRKTLFRGKNCDMALSENVYAPFIYLSSDSVVKRNGSHLFAVFWIVPLLCFFCFSEQDASALQIPLALGPDSEFAGNLFMAEKDLEMRKSLELRTYLWRSYNSRSKRDGLFGLGWICDPLDVRIVYEKEGKVTLIRGDGQEEPYSTANGTDYFPDAKANTKGLRLSMQDDGTYVLLLSNGWYWKFNTRGYLVLKRDKIGNRLEIKRERDGCTPLYVQGPFGGRISFLCDNFRIVTAEGPAGVRCKYEYNDSGKLARKIDPVGQESVFKYDSDGRLNYVRLAGNPPERFSYLDGLLSKYELEGIGSLSFRYLPLPDQMGGYVQETSNELGMTVKRLEISDSERRRIEIDGLGNRNVLKFDGEGRLISRQRPVGKEERWQYNQTGMLQSYDDPSGNRTTYQWNDADAALTITYPRGAEEVHEYDTKGLLKRIVDPWGVPTEFQRDQHGRVVSILYGKQVTLTNQYGNDGHLQRIEGVRGTADFERDKLGYVTRMKNENGGEIIFENDLNGRPVFRKDGEGRSVRWSYDKAGRLTSITDGEDGRIEFFYSDNGILKLLRDANKREYKFQYEQGTLKALTFPNNTSESATKDAFGRLKEETDHQGRNIQYESDGLGRVVLRRMKGQDTLWKYDEFGRLVYTSNDHTSYRIHYNRFGDVEQIDDGKGRTVRYSYNDKGQRVAMVDPEGKKTSYQYGTRGKLVRIVGPNGEDFRFDYDQAGQLKKRGYPNGIASSFNYDPSGLISGITTTNRNGDVLDFVIVTRDRSGNIVKMKDKEGTWNYEYDLAGRLVDVKGSGAYQESFAYDAAGNRTGQVREGKRDSPDYGPLNEILGDGQFKYIHNKNGERIQRSDGTRYQYNALGQLTSVETADGQLVRYFYDPFGRLIAREIDGKRTEYFYDKEDVIAEYSERTPAPAMRYVHGPGVDEPLALWKKRQLYTYALGINNSVRSVHGQDGRAVTKYAFSPFGELLHSTSNTFGRYMFNARYWDDVTQLYYARARFLDPLTGRFISPDPIRFQGGWNLYAYVSNDPINTIDPLGLRGWLQSVIPTPKQAITLAVGYALYKSGYTETSCGTSLGTQAALGVGSKMGFNTQYFGPGDPRNGNYSYIGPSIGGLVSIGNSPNVAIGRAGAEWKGHFVEIDTPFGGVFFSPEIPPGWIGYSQGLVSPSFGSWQFSVVKYTKAEPGVELKPGQSPASPPDEPIMATPGWNPPPQLPAAMSAEIEKRKKELQALAAGAESRSLIEKERKRLQQLIEKAEAEQSLQAQKAQKTEEAQKNAALEAAIQKAIEYGVLARKAAAEAKAAIAKARQVVTDSNAAVGAVDGLKSAVREAESTIKGVLSKCEEVEKSSDLSTVSEEAARLSASVGPYTEKANKLSNEVCEQVTKNGAVTQETKSRGEELSQLKADAELLFKQAKEKTQRVVDAGSALKAAKEGAKQAMDISTSLMSQAGQARTEISEAQKAVESGQGHLRTASSKGKEAEKYKNLALKTLEPYASVPKAERLISEINAIGGLSLENEHGEVSEGLKGLPHVLRKSLSGLGETEEKIGSRNQDLTKCAALEIPADDVDRATHELEIAGKELEKIKMATTRGVACVGLEQKPSTGCENIAGEWSIEFSTTWVCKNFEDGTIDRDTMKSTVQVTITQTGCDLSGPELSGTVDGKAVRLSYSIGLDEVKSTSVANGTISGKSFRLNGKGTVADKEMSCEEESVMVFIPR